MCFLFEPGVGVGRGEGRVLMMSLCMQMHWWEEFGISHFLLCIEIFRIGSYSLREPFSQMINFFLFPMLLTNCRDAIKFFKNNLRFLCFKKWFDWMHQLNLSLVFKILIKSKGNWCGNKTLDERGHVMLECIMVNAGATRYIDFRIFGQKVGMILGAETLKGKNSEGTGGSKNQILT